MPVTDTFAETYEEGTWTPALTFATPGDLSVAYDTQVGRYTRIGRMVFVDVAVETSSFTYTTASGNLRLTGLPFTVSSTVPPYTFLAVTLLDWTGGAGSHAYMQAEPGATYGVFFTAPVSGGAGDFGGNLGTPEMPTGRTPYLYATGFYFV